ncbi:TetR/AcrR family transcriptional regulator (plasmid) [Tistrella bauzanensis]|uniref:TetR/AcrR family transcriptional regulator n=1 Tax=Tistrella arctica TaxID=3133430 RepID=A0ABU9YNG6_9PROT
MARLIHERADVVRLLAEVFRAHGFEGASLGMIASETGLGRGSLYHFFPGGKEEMAAAVLAEIDRWFTEAVFAPLRAAAASGDGDAARAAMQGMCAVSSQYFRSGRRVCLVGAFALDSVRDRFALAIRSYFTAWIDALAAAIETTGVAAAPARQMAADAVADIQGAVVLARALDDTAVFEGRMRRLAARLTGDDGAVLPPDIKPMQASPA